MARDAPELSAPQSSAKAETYPPTTPIHHIQDASGRDSALSALVPNTSAAIAPIRKSHLSIPSTVPDVRFSWDRVEDMATARPGTRDRILDATARILVRDGGDALTIAAIAHEAGVSKGGLFYHFPSKDDVVTALMERFIQSFDELLSNAGHEPGAATRAYLRSAEEPRSVATQPVIALLAALTVRPRALGALRERYDEWARRLDDDGVPSEVSDLIRFAVDGLWLADLLDLAALPSQRRAALLEHLDRLLDGCQTRQ